MHQQDPFSQFRDFINRMETRFQEIAKDYGVEHLAGPQGFAVRYLLDNQDKEIFVKDIEKRLNISKSVASNLVKRMEKNGFVDLIASDKDKRYKTVRLTELGKEKAVAVETFKNQVHAQVLQGIDPKEVEIAFKVFHQIQHNLEKTKE